MTENPDSSFWITTRNGLYHFDPKTGAWERYFSRPGDPTTLNSNLADSIVRDSPRSIWVIAAKELNHFDEITHRVDEHVVFSEPHTIIALHPDRTGTVWVARSHEDCAIATLDLNAKILNCMQPTDEQGKNALHSGTNALLEARDGSVWFGTQVDGLFKFDHASGQFTQFRNHVEDGSSVGSDDIRSLFQDRSGNVWVALMTGGVDQFPLGGPKVAVISREHGDLHSNFVTAVYEDAGVLWIASDGGLNRIDRSMKSNRVPSGPGLLGQISTIIRDPKGRILAGTYREGIRVLDQESGQFRPWLTDESQNQTGRHPITRLLFDHRGNLWAATWAGLELIDQKSGRVTEFTPEASYAEFNDLKEDRTGRLWLASASGLLSFDPETQHFSSFKDDERSDNSSSFVHVDTHGRIWVAMKDGLASFDPELGKFRNFSSEGALVGHAVGCILEDEHDQLWLGTDQGLARVDTASGTIQAIPIDSGPSQPDLTNRSSCYRAPGGEMIFGGYDGAIVFRPQDIPDSPPTPRVALTDFRIFGRTISPGPHAPLRESITYAQNVILRHDQSVFTIGFAALNAYSNTGIRYRYRLRGVDTDWHNASSNERLASYSTLPAGTYYFQVQASLSAAGWSGPITQLTVHVIPPWWATWWFRSLYLVAILFGIWASHRRRVVAMYKEVTLRLSERVEERNLVARELHDTLVQTVEGCRILAETAVSRNEREDMDRSTLEQLVTWLTRASEEGRVAMQILRPPSEKKADLRLDLMRFARDCSPRGEVHFVAEASEAKSNFRAGIQEEVYRIACEAIRNAVRHAGAKEIMVGIDTSRDFILRVTDDGIGIPEAIRETGLSNHYGLRGMRERAEKLGGRLQIRSRELGGTEVELSIPGRTAFTKVGAIARLMERFGFESPDLVRSEMITRMSRRDGVMEREGKII